MSATETKKMPVLIDCDPGADDVFALLWILINHKFAHIPMELVGITTVGGNVSADKTYANALRMCEFVGATDIPVGKDHRQIVSQDASHIHGNDGIGNLSAMLPPVALPATEKDSVDMIIEAIEKYGKELAILVTGPMTNISLAEERKPGILSQCKKIIAMGGAMNVGWNITPVAEFNISYDAVSAAKVFKATNNIMLLPLDLTTSMVFSAEDMENCFKNVNHSTKQEFMRELTKFTIGTNTMFRETAYEKWFYVHDAHTVWLLLYPHIYKWTFHQVNVETQGEYTKWETIIDTRNHARTEVNTYVATEFNKELFLEAISEDLKQFDFS
jgi:inosine-uridine nucleoside N-ribohydrolase